MSSKKSTVERATSAETVDAIVDTTRRQAIPLRRTFIQQKDERGRSEPGPLAQFVAGGDLLALRLYFLVVTKASTDPWDVSLHSAVFARALGLPNPTSLTSRGRISKAWGRLVERKLVRRSRRNRLAEITLLCEDGSGESYTRPQTSFIKIPHEFWRDGPSPDNRWHEVLTLPELTFLVIARSNHDWFSLPAERGPDYYGISADTLQRGATGLRRRGLLEVELARVKAPLTPDGFTNENRYTLRPPFGPMGSRSTAASRPR